MYPVSEAFLQAVQGNTRKYYWTGKITTAAGAEYPFDQEDIVKGSGYSQHSAAATRKSSLDQCMRLRWGSACSWISTAIRLRVAKAELTYHLRLADGTYEAVPMGIFEVSEANRTAMCWN